MADGLPSGSLFHHVKVGGRLAPISSGLLPSGFSPLPSRYKVTKKIAHFQGFSGLCVDTIWLYVEMFWRFVGKYWQLFVPRETLTEKLNILYVLQVTEILSIFAARSSQAAGWIKNKKQNIIL